MVQGKLVPMRGRCQSHYHNLKGLYQSVIFLVDICLGCGYANFFSHIVSCTLYIRTFIKTECSLRGLWVCIICFRIKSRIYRICTNLSCAESTLYFPFPSWRINFLDLVVKNKYRFGVKKRFYCIYWFLLTVIFRFTSGSEQLDFKWHTSGENYKGYHSFSTEDR